MRTRGTLLGAAAAVALGILVVSAPTAVGKGIDLSLAADRTSPRVGEQIAITLRGTPTIPLSGSCRPMRIVAVAPGVGVRAALRSLEGGRVSRRIGDWGAFRLASMRSVGRLHWTARLRPGAVGRWTLVVPSVCAAGYILPEGAARLTVDVRP